MTDATVHEPFLDGGGADAREITASFAGPRAPFGHVVVAFRHEAWGPRSVQDRSG
jgi:hypothetical protein